MYALTVHCTTYDHSRMAKQHW